MNQFNSIPRLGKDAEVKTLESGKTVISFSGAIDVGYGDRKTTMWVEYSYFTDKTSIAQYLKKGTQIFCTGEIKVRAWTSNAGEPGATIQCTIREIKLLGNAPQQQQGGVTNTARPPQGSDEIAEVDSLPF